MGINEYTVADPGFTVGGRAPVRRERGTLTRVFFGENVCEKERIGSHTGWHVPGTPPPLDPPMIYVGNMKKTYLNDDRTSWLIKRRIMC